MSRIQEKVKDLIEVHEYESLLDFQSEPSKTLSSYRFTDVTSELMAQWLDTVIEVRSENGKAKALAGYRGVGKSHFLAAFGAIIAHPELRSRITDAHVSSSAQVLMRRPYPVAFARRGTEESLLEELRIGVSKALEVDVSTVPEDIENILSFIAEKTNDIPFILIIDTAFERDSRVSRDDGLFLGELAERSKHYDIFIAVALDDDITDADGINLAISRSYTIDYLNQEHLNKIVHKHIFPKNRQAQRHLNDIYRYFREYIPGFRWSDQTFSSLYPLHPSILELAQFIRLYAPHFALLGFASEAGARILGRPANSLIALDEVFDNVENSLRKAKDLTEAFEIYDKISQEVVLKIPIMQRLQAKLILKALFILSLDGDGTTAKEIAATMLIYEEGEPQKAIDGVQELLDKIVSVFPEDLNRVAVEGKENKYYLKVSSKDNLNAALDTAIQSISDDVIPKVLLRVANDKFSDWNLSKDNDDESNLWTDCQVNWRGGQRRCRLYWNWGKEIETGVYSSENTDHFDLEVFINNPQNENLENVENNNVLQTIWKPNQLTRSERNTILRFHVLLNDESLRSEYSEQIRAAGHKLILEIEKIWNKVFVSEATILYENETYFLDGTDIEKQTLGGLLSNSLEPIFEKIYPEHPRFNETLGMLEVSKLVNDLFSGARKTHEGVQTLAKNYALPLGIVNNKTGSYVLETEETLFKLPLVERVIGLLNQSENSKVSLKDIYKSLKEKPYGLVREAQHLILAALVAQRKIEFITTNGDTINRRSLDLNIIWDDIAGIAKPASIIYETKRLTVWAKLLTELEDVQTIDLSEERTKVIDALRIWLDKWQESQILDGFSKLPDEILNTKIWYKSVNIEKSFGSVANSLNNFFEESISLEVCLQRIADSFTDSEEEFYNYKKDLVILKSFIENAPNREKVWNYLAVCDRTENSEIEILREKLFDLLEKAANQPNFEVNEQMEFLWNEFHSLYSETFAHTHNMVMKSHDLQEKYDQIIKSDPWWEFQNLSTLPIFHQKHWIDAQKIISKFQELDCKYNVRELLENHPTCVCSFNVTQIKDWEKLPISLVKTIEKGRKSYRKTLFHLSDTVVKLLEPLILNETDETLLESANDLKTQFENKKGFKKFNTHQLTILNKIFETMVSSPTVNVQYPQDTDLMNSSELRQNMNKWMDELPTESAYLKVN